MTLKNKEPVEIVVIMDQSGSMRSMWEEALDGFNNFVEAQKELDGEANLSLILFDDRYEQPMKRVPLQDVKKLTKVDYKPLGMTAMNDAIGRTLTEMLSKDSEKAIVCILTDGMENASKEYTREAVQQLTTVAEDRGWEFVFVAANIDANSTATSLGMARALKLNVSANGAGATEAYATMNASAKGYRQQ